MKENDQPLFRITPEDDPNNPVCEKQHVVFFFLMMHRWKQNLQLRLGKKSQIRLVRLKISPRRALSLVLVRLFWSFLLIILSDYFGYGVEGVSDLIAKLPGAENCAKFRGMPIEYSISYAYSTEKFVVPKYNTTTTAQTSTLHMPMFTQTIPAPSGSAVGSVAAQRPQYHPMQQPGFPYHHYPYFSSLGIISGGGAGAAAPGTVPPASTAPPGAASLSSAPMSGVPGVGVHPQAAQTSIPGYNPSLFYPQTHPSMYQWQVHQQLMRQQQQQQRQPQQPQQMSVMHPHQQVYHQPPIQQQKQDGVASTGTSLGIGIQSPTAIPPPSGK